MNKHYSIKKYTRVVEREGRMWWRCGPCAQQAIMRAACVRRKGKAGSLLGWRVVSYCCRATNRRLAFSYPDASRAFVQREDPFWPNTQQESQPTYHICCKSSFLNPSIILNTYRWQRKNELLGAKHAWTWGPECVLVSCSRKGEKMEKATTKVRLSSLVSAFRVRLRSAQLSS